MSIEQQLKEIDELEIKLSELKKKLLLDLGDNKCYYLFSEYKDQFNKESVLELYNIYLDHATEDTMCFLKHAYLFNKEYIKYFNKNYKKELQEKIYHILMNMYLTQQEKDTFINLLIIEH